MRFVEPPPGDVRDTMADIFSRDEFQRSKNAVQRLVEWLGQQLEKLFGREPTATAPSGGAGWGGPIGTIILWVVLALLAGGLVVLIVHLARNWTRRAKPAEVVTEVEIEERRSIGEWAVAAEGFESAGEWKEALRCRYRELVGRLVEHGAVSPVPGRTTGELRSDLGERVPAALVAFSGATELFELAWYADRGTGPAENARFRAFAAEVADTAGRSGTASAPELEAVS